MKKRARDSGVEGVLLVDKPAGVTSHDVVGTVRRALDTRVVGHAGTLDPFATGLLVVLVGRYTRLSPYVTDDDKRYLAEIAFGARTDTDDATGVVVEERSADGVSVDDVARALPRFTGTFAQTVPDYSAVSQDGERLYARARRGDVVDAPTREVTIHTLALRAFDDTRKVARLEVSCAKGTYIRALARDLGATVGVPAHCAALRRLASGAYLVEEALTLDDVAARGAGALARGRAAVRGLPFVDVTNDDAVALRQGRAIPSAAVVEEERPALAWVGEEPVAVVVRRGAHLHVVRGFGEPPLSARAATS